MADVTIDAALHTADDHYAVRGGPFWTSTTVGYVFYIDGSVDLKYNKTSDGGANWGGATNVKTGSIVCFDCWADWQTDGDAGTKINIAYMDLDVPAGIRYCYLDTDGDSVGGDDQVEACQGTGDFGAQTGHNYNSLSITKARGGNFGVAFTYLDSDSTRFDGFYTSSDADTWNSKNDPIEATPDHILLFPANLADNQDLWALYWDIDADEISLQTFDNSGNSWSEQSISGSMADSTVYLQMDGQVRLSDGHLIMAAWNLYDNADADLMVWDITDAGTITAKANIITNEAESFLVSVFINQVNDDIYIAYTSGTAAQSLVKVFYDKSDDGGGTWGGETAMQADVEDDMRWVGAGCIKSAWGGLFQPVWFDDDQNDLFCNTDNRVSIAAVAAGWANKFNGVANAAIGKINGVAIASIGKVNGVA